MVRLTNPYQSRQREPHQDRAMQHHDENLFQEPSGVTTATLTTVLLKKGLRNVWIRGAFPLTPGTPRVVGRAFTVRFIPAREDLATPASWGAPKSSRAAA
jgi:regulator of RNase E activity RraA